MAYGPSVLDNFRQAASYVDKILRGASPYLPVQQPTRFDLVVNMKTAKTLGLTIPQSILCTGRSDRRVNGLGLLTR